MRKISLWSVFVGVSLFLATTMASAAEKVVVYGDDSYPPYTYLDAATKKPMGIYVEILQAVFAKMVDYEVTIELVPWKNALNKVETGSGLAMFPPYYNKERGLDELFDADSRRKSCRVWNRRKT